MEKSYTMNHYVSNFELENDNNNKENNKENIKEKKKVYVETNENIRNRVKIFEDREKKNRSLKEELDYRQKVYEQNRANARERMRRLKQFLKDKKDNTKTNEEFFEINKEFFLQNGVKSYDELLKLIHNYDKENIEEIEREIFEKYKKNLKIEKQSYEEGKEGFSILAKIESKFTNLETNLSSLSENIHFTKNKKFKSILQKCDKINEIKIIPDMDKYIKEKMNLYEVKSITNEGINYLSNKKIKYNPDSELQIVSNEENVFLENENKNILSKGENFMENGIPINELIDSKIKSILGRLSENDKINYQKVEQIIKDLNDNKDKEFYNDLIKKNFCIDCDTSFDNDNKEHCSLHKEHNFIQIEKGIFNDLDEELNININELDYNASLKKIYEHLKREQNKVLKYGKNIIINFYADLLFHLYEIIVNNNSIEDLNESIIIINELYKSKIEPIEGEVNDYFKNYFLFYVQRITKLSYHKLKKIEKLMAEILDINNKNNEEADIYDDGSDSENQNTYFDSIKVKRSEIDNIFEKDEINKNNNKQLENEGNKKYFLRLGLDLKFKYSKNESINELYNKALEKGIEPKFYESFILSELNVIK